MTSSHCRAKKRWRGKALLSESLWSCGQVTRSASACIYLTRTVSSLQESVVENTGEGWGCSGSSCHCASSIQLSLHNEDGWEGKIRWGDFSGRKKSIGFLDNPDLQKKKKKVGMDRDIKKEGNSRETAAQDSRKRLWYVRDFFGEGRELCFQTGQRWKPILHVKRSKRTGTRRWADFCGLRIRRGKDKKSGAAWAENHSTSWALVSATSCHWLTAFKDLLFWFDVYVSAGELNRATVQKKNRWED